MKRKKLFLLFASTCLILVLAVSPFMAACAKPAVEPGVAEIAALQKEVASLEKKIAAAPKAAEVTKLEKEKTALEKDKTALEKEIAAAEKEIAKLEAAAPAPAEKVYEWRMQAFGVRGSLYFQSATLFCDIIRTASGGRVDITPFGMGEVVGMDTLFEAVGGGTVEMGIADPNYWMPKTGGVSGLAHWPYTTTRWENTRGMLDWLGVMDDVIRPAYMEHNVYPVRIMETGYDSFFATKFPVTSLADFQGHKIRGMGIQAEVFTAATGIPAIFITMSEVYSAADRGVIDGCMSGPITGVYDFGIHEPFSYLVQPVIGPCNLDITINLDTWNALPDSLKQILDSAAADTESFINGCYAVEDWRHIEIMKKDFGYKLCTLPDSDVRKMAAASMDVMDEYAEKDARFAEGAAILKDFMRMRGLLE